MADRTAPRTPAVADLAEIGDVTQADVAGDLGAIATGDAAVDGHDQIGAPHGSSEIGCPFNSRSAIG